jgi:hypothetical protein
MRGRTLVVPLTPDKVPNGSDEEESGKDDRGVVHCLRRDGEVRWHGEEGDGESGPAL